MKQTTELNDRELLELAAKAAGLKVIADGSYNKGMIIDLPLGRAALWDPINDDGDALRLAVKLGIPIYGREIGCTAGGDDGHFFDAEDFGGDIYAATRHAITHAAAEIGRRMP